LEISHPNLVDLPTIRVASLVAVPLWLPKLKTLIRHVNSKYLDGFLTPQRVGQARQLHLQLPLKRDMQLDPSFLEIAKHKKAYSIMLETLRTKNIATQIHQIQTLSRLRFLKGCYRRRDLELILRDLPLLQDLEIHIRNDGAPLTWLKHPRLRYLYLDILSANAETTISNSCLEISNQDFPNLAGLRISIPPEIWQVEISDLPLLGVFGLLSRDHEALQGLSLSMHGCMILNLLDVDRFRIEKFAVEQATNLRRLMLANCEIAEGVYIPAMVYPRIERVVLTKPDYRFVSELRASSYNINVEVK
jgi:hypothetical protein